MQIKIRKAVANDITSIQELNSLFDSEPNPCVSLSESLRTLDEIEEIGAVLLAEIGNKVVGVCSVYVCPTLMRGARPFSVLEHIVVSKEYRRRGVARSLIDVAVAHAANAGCYKVMLMTGLNRKENHLFYESCGFVGDKVGFQKRIN